jgi:sterol desaturase/sphingolipid hydroxylase (fatty acid hydroxylase superfamily)
MTLRNFLGSTTGLVVCLGLAALGGWLLWSHTGHVLSALPFLLLLACPLMHLMHRGHGRHGSEHAKTTNLPSDGKSGG